MITVTGDIAVGAGIDPASAGLTPAYVRVRAVAMFTTAGTTVLPSTATYPVNGDGTFSISVLELPTGYAYGWQFVLGGGAVVTPERLTGLPASGPVAWPDLPDVATPQTPGYAPPSWYFDLATIRDQTLAARDESIVTVSPSTDWSGAQTITAAQARGYLIRRLTGNVTLTMPNGPAGQAISCTLELRQDATGGRSIIIANAGTPEMLPLPLSQGANAVTILQLLWNGNVWRAALGLPNVGIPASWTV